MKVLITGATGLVGQEIVKQCHSQNIDVNYLSTNRSKIVIDNNYKGFYWNPKTNEIDIDCFQEVDVIINLAGASVAKRWTDAYKKEILDSRLDGLRLLYTTIKNQNIPIRHLISASAIGIYPDSITQYYEEDFKIDGDGFLSKVTKQWENEAQKFEQIGVNLSIVRIGIVLSSKGGALPKLYKPIKNYVGATLGNGKQWQSWIHIEDLAALFLYLVSRKLYGTFNGVAPNAVTQGELVKAVAKTLKKPLLLPKIPSIVLKTLLGEMSTLVLESQRVSSKKVEKLGFTFKQHHVQLAIDDLLL